jgi:hypothetical protein
VIKKHYEEFEDTKREVIRIPPIHVYVHVYLYIYYKLFKFEASIDGVVSILILSQL